MPASDQSPLRNRLRSLIDALKYRGRATVTELATDLELNVETVREHLRTLETRQLVRRDGTQRQGPGRPEVVFVLTADAEALFPRREGEMLQALTRYLVAQGQAPLLRGFLKAHAAERREQGLTAIAGLSGKRRVDEVVQLFDDMGFMPVLEGNGTTLRLCHCPLRDMVEVTQLPCRQELDLLRDLLGSPLVRMTHLPRGDAACVYHIGEEA